MKKISYLVVSLLVAASLHASASNMVQNLFVQAGAGSTARADKLNDIVVTPQDFGAKCDNVTDDTTKIQAALNSLTTGGRLHIRGTCLASAALVIPSNVIVDGDGIMYSRLHFTHTGDGLTTTSPINSSTSKYVTVRDIALYNTNASNTGGGYVDVGGSYISVRNVQFSGWRFGVIFDQTEIADITRNQFIGWGYAGIWLVNGPDHTAGANKGFTNRITIAENQLNGSSGYGVQDDGGVNHILIGNNFNSASVQVYAAGVSGLSIINNEFEGATSYPIEIAENTVAGSFVGQTTGMDISGNTLGGGSVSIFMQSVQGGRITANVFYQYANYAMEADFGANRRVNGVDVSGNSKAVIGAGKTAGPFINQTRIADWEAQGSYRQNGQTYVSSAFSAGTQTITPQSMEGITDGVQLRVMNADGTNVETVTATVDPTAPTTFKATLATAKAANWTAVVLDAMTSGTYTPALSGTSTAGTFTTSVAYGSYQRVKKRLLFQVDIAWSATGGAAGQLQMTLPFAAKNDNIGLVIPVSLSGPGAIGITGPVYLSFVKGSNVATFITMNTSSGAWQSLSVPASGEITVSGGYEL